MDNAVVIVYLAVILVVGLRRGYRTKTIRDFAVGDKNFSIAVLLATISATYTGGGSTLGTTERIFNNGIIYAIIITMLSNILYKFIVAYYITPRFSSLQNYISLGEVMGSFYGKSARIATGLFGAIKCVGAFGTQTAAMGFIFHFFLGASFESAVIAATIIVILYTMFGGIRAVAATDLIQFGVLLLGIAIIFNCALGKVGGYAQLWAKLPDSHKVFFSNTDLLVKHLVILFIFTAPFLNPAEAQRLLLSKDIKKTRTSMFAAVALDPIIFFLISCIGLCAIVLFPNINGNVAMLTVIKEVIPSSILRGVCIAGLLAVVMSTADSCLNSATVALVNDFLIPLNNLKISQTFEMWLVRAITAILGFSSIFVTLYFRNVLDIVIAFVSFWGTFMCVPFLAGLHKLNASSQCFWASTLLGVPTFALWLHFFQPITHIHPIFPGLLMSALGFFIMYGYEKFNNTKNLITT